MKFSVFQLSRKGGRQKNEDRMGYSYTRQSGLFVLADGMGGHPEGEVASQMALQALSAQFQKAAQPTVPQVHQFLTDSLLSAHRQILGYALGKGMPDSPRTTLVAVLVQDGTASWIHCGDSRLYLVRNGELLVRTRDHSYAEQQAAGLLNLEHVNRNVLFTCLGSPTTPVYDTTGPVMLQRGDKLLLCSDGLWGSVSDDDIVHLLAARPVSQAVPQLAEKALAKAGARSDNVTIIALEWETPNHSDLPSDISTDSVGDGFATTIQAAATDTSDDDFDDAAIERSIAEINAAIRRSAARKL